VYFEGGNPLMIIIYQYLTPVVNGLPQWSLYIRLIMTIYGNALFWSFFPKNNLTKTLQNTIILIPHPHREGITTKEME
jgi:hypothetical protein